ncbi:RNA polymerase factor sigma-54 [Neisseria wadsworthii]|uniref:RNA polymerase factor sigma-54 n=1 Tax=Neisseria wadsworthii TaxID=607711 RepID=UPI0015F507A0|nr:RNA polymerase factor sigma-54 [Neisseria wadsworthii]QMT35878.1 RNA polymerase factor sigma-54 [Neisseria wadsworthii]
MSGQSFHLKLKQTQQLNQTMQQSLRVLQMSGIELEREVDDWLQDNPLLERGETPEAPLEQNTVSATVGSRNKISGDEAEDIWATIAEEEDFIGYLHKQVCEHPLTQIEAARVHILIDFLDEQGYLTDSIPEVIDHCPLEWMLDEDEMREALDHLQTFDPPGVGAASLTESLLLQLQRLPASPARQCAAKIVHMHLDDLSKSVQQNIAKLKKHFPDYDTAVIQSALDMVAQLNPFPAYGFASAEPTSYIQPDVIIKEDKDGKWVVQSNEAAWPRIQINRELTDALKEESGVDSVWREKIQEARQKVDSLELRKSTVLRLAEYIVEKQEDFFVFGEIGLTPMLLKDAAQELDVAESTVSRAVNQKYLSCPRGLFALRYFFTHAVSADESGEGVSQGAVKAMLAQLIAGENKKKPYSDEAISSLLKQQGVDIARRTVAKYRETLGIPPASQRKG